MRILAGYPVPALSHIRSPFSENPLEVRSWLRGPEGDGRGCSASRFMPRPGHGLACVLALGSPAWERAGQLACSLFSAGRTAHGEAVAC